jgi:hypothetical protein
MKFIKITLMAVFTITLFFSPNSFAVKTMIPGFSYELGSSGCETNVINSDLSMKMTQVSYNNTCRGIFPLQLPEGPRLISKLSFSYDATNSHCEEMRIIFQERDFETGAIERVDYAGTNTSVDVFLPVGQSGTHTVSNIDYQYTRDKMLYLDVRISADPAYDADHCLIRDIRVHNRAN